MNDEIYEWVSWYKYLLPSLVQRSDECFIDCLIENTINAFVGTFPDSLETVYSRFRDDALRTVGLALMKAEFWDEQGECIPAVQVHNR